jgi:hypothetical protein
VQKERGVTDAMGVHTHPVAPQRAGTHSGKSTQAVECNIKNENEN